MSIWRWLAHLRDLIDPRGAEQIDSDSSRIDSLARSPSKLFIVTQVGQIRRTSRSSAVGKRIRIRNATSIHVSNSLLPSFASDFHLIFPPFSQPDLAPHSRRVLDGLPYPSKTISHPLASQLQPRTVLVSPISQLPYARLWNLGRLDCSCKW